MKRDTLIKFYKNHQADASPALSAHAKSGIKARVLQNLHTPITPVRMPRSWTFFYTRYAVVTVGILALLTGTAYASSSAIPGDALYPVKRAVENTRVKLAQNSETKAKLQVQFTKERLQELETVAQLSPLKPTTILSIQPTTQPATAPIAPSTAAIIEPEPERQETQAEHSAREEVRKALKKLEQTKEDLDKQGKTAAADDLSKTIHFISSEITNKRRTKPDAEHNNTHKMPRPSDAKRTEPQTKQEAKRNFFQK